MALTSFQINEFTKRAKIAGLNDDEIRQEIENKAREIGGQPPAFPTLSAPQRTTQAGSTQQQPISQSTSQSSMSTSTSRSAVVNESSGFVADFIKSLVQPAVDYGKFVGEAAFQAGRFTFDPAFRKSVFGRQDDLTDEELERLSREDTTLFLDEEKIGDRKKILETGGKATAGGLSYAIPFGKGANLMSKVFIPGAASGALNELSREDATAESVVESGVTGAATAGVIEGLGGMISWARGKGGDLVRQSQKLEEGTRKIKVKASVFGASQEQSINNTLDNYGFKGSADEQYAKLEPIMGEIEGKIQNIIKDNPDLGVSVESIKKSFMNNLKGSLRTRDLTKKQAVEEINGYLNDIYLAAGDVVPKEGQNLIESGLDQIPLATLREMKKILNQDYGSVYKKIERGTSLNSREKVIEAAWDSLDDAIRDISPEIKKLLVDESNLYRASQPLSSARFNPPTLRVMGTSVPSGITQKARDAFGGVMNKLGIGAQKLPENTQTNNLERFAAILPSVFKKRETEQTTPEGVLPDVTSNLSNNNSGVEQFATDLTQPGTEPNSLNPFGSLTKRQVLSLALTNGAKKSDLEDISAIYDMMAADTGTISSETMAVADSLRTEYFKRTAENDFIDVLNSYQKVVNTSESAAGDVSLIFAFMKMLDPGSVVREGEFATAENTAGIPDMVRNQYNKAISGKKLSTEQRSAFKNEAGRVFEVYQQRQAPIDAYYQGLAQRYGIDPSLLGIGLYQ